jgi:hypothetical protein
LWPRFRARPERPRGPRSLIVRQSCAIYWRPIDPNAAPKREIRVIVNWQRELAGKVK